MIIDKPPMGWNSWNTFAENIDEKLIRDTADAMVKSGLKDLGYEYVIIDDCWALRERDKDGKMVPDPKKFPSGMKALSDYIHGLGLKFGMYSCVGTMTCARYPAGLDHEFVDAQSFAEWGIDYLKYDYCFKPEMLQGRHLYRRMGAALANCGRDVLFAACSWGADKTHEWIRTADVHTWRSTGDIVDSFPSVKLLLQAQIPILPYGGQGCFNDMDMLIVGMHGKGNVGVTGCTFEEYRLHFSAWALLASPLIIGCDVRNMDKETLSILGNRDVIAVNQDRGGRQVYCVGSEEQPIFVRQLSNGDYAIGLFNLADGDGYMWLPLDELGLPYSTGKKLECVDLWSGEKVHTHNGGISAQIKAHDCLLLRAKIVNA